MSFEDVFPTHVGVFLFLYDQPAMTLGLPHARGGVSAQALVLGSAQQSSPRTWGCFRQARTHLQAVGVFPTHVGVFLRLVSLSGISERLPHARGGVSKLTLDAAIEEASSPRTWGCFRPGFKAAPYCKVFPTHVGVFPSTDERIRRVLSLPHARGGVSQWGQCDQD